MPYSYIKVAMHGHFDNQLQLCYSFNPSDDPSQGWEASLPDPEAIVRSFMSVRDCYVMWANKHGHYFSLITNHPVDKQAGRVMITVMLENGDAVAGRQIYGALNQLRKAFLEDDMLSEQGVEQALQAAMLPEKPMKLPSWIGREPAQHAKPMAYRTYLSTRELEVLFSFPNQTDYRTYRYIIIISATSSLRPGVGIDRLGQPVKKEYDVVLPEGVEASQLVIADGDRLTLNFSKEGFAPRKETVTVGSPSPYLRYDGSALLVKAPADSGMGFVKKIRMEVRSAKGGVVTGYTVSVNERPVNTMDNLLELTEADLRPDRKVVVRAASNNYHPLKLELDPSTLDQDSVVVLEMVPVEQGIVLRLDFGEGRIVEQQIALEKNTPEYSQLRSGMFHGFRAHRLSSPGSNGEVYNVDVRSSAKPVAPVFENVARQPQPEPAPVKEESKIAEEPVKEEEAPASPVPEKVEEISAPAVKPAESAKHEAEEAKTPVAPVFENTTGPHKPQQQKTPQQSSVKTDDKKSEKDSKVVPEYTGTGIGSSVDDDKQQGNMMLIGAIIVALIAIGAIIYFIIGMISDGSDRPVVAQEDAEPVEMVAQAPQDEDTAAVVAPVAPVENAPTPSSEADVAADWEYLSTHDVWQPSAMKSAQGKALFNAIQAGDLEAFAKSPYFATVAKKSRQYAVGQYAWKAIDSKLAQSNAELLVKLGKGDEIKVYDLWDGLSRIQPGEPNPAPWPYEQK